MFRRAIRTIGQGILRKLIADMLRNTNLKKRLMLYIASSQINSGELKEEIQSK